MKLIIQPFSEYPLGDVLKSALKGEFGEFHSFQAAIAFAKYAGVRHIQNELRGFVQKGKNARIIVGVDHLGTSRESLVGLLTAVGEKGEIWINHSRENYITFHPKVYLFEGDEKAILIIGSGNLTQGGLYTNDEASSLHQLDLSNASDKAILDELKADFDAWSDEDFDNARRLDQAFLETLVEVGYVMTEAAMREELGAKIDANRQRAKASSQKETAEQANKTSLFGKTAFKRSAPKYKKSVAPPKHKPVKPSKTTPSSKDAPDRIEEDEDVEARGFVMTLQQTDVGVGQTTSGTSRRSPEIFIPLSARNSSPEFWGWQDKFIEDPNRPGKFDRLNVQMRIGGETVSVNMMTWPIKHDFRLRSERLRSAGNIGDILRIEKTEETMDFSYYVEIIPQGTSDYEAYLALCNNKTRNSKKLWGYYS